MNNIKQQLASAKNNIAVSKSQQEIIEVREFAEKIGIIKGGVDANKDLRISEYNGDNFEFSKEFESEFLNLENNKELLKQPLLVLDIIFKIIQDLKINMYHVQDDYLYDPQTKKTNNLKKQTWETLVINSEKNELLRTYKISDILKTRNKAKMTEALEFLKMYKNETYTFKNGYGEEITTSGGLIKDWYYLEKKGYFEIKISLYWANKIVKLEKNHFNNIKLNVFKEFKNIKQRFFVLWLMKIGSNGTKKKYIDIIENFDLNYDSSYETLRSFVMPVKRILDDKSKNNEWFSINTFLDDENKNNICFKRYDIKPNKNVEEGSKPDKTDVEERRHEKYLKTSINYYSKYVRKQHLLSKDDLEVFKEKHININNVEAFKNKYDAFKKHIKHKDYNGKRRTVEYINQDFVKLFEEVINGL